MHVSFYHILIIKVLKKVYLFARLMAFASTPLLFYNIYHVRSGLERSSFLSSQGVDLNPRDRERCTPLLLAAAHGCSAVVSLLLENGADVTCEDEKRRTALHWAVGQDKTIERLLKVKQRITLSARDVLFRFTEIQILD